MLVGASVGIATGAVGIPGPGGVIQGCYDSGGNVKVVAYGAACPRTYTPLQWNQQGIQGIPGEPAALIPASKVFGVDEQPLSGTKSFAFGQTINVTSIQIGDVGAGLKEILGGTRSIVLDGTLATGGSSVFLWEGPRTAQLSFGTALPLTGLSATCILPANDCDITLSVIGY
jgi:hypothetical protein